MQVLKWIIVVLAFFQGGWLAFDGGRALIAGDYITPRSGPYAGQLGPWSRVVAKAGLEPRSTFVKALHVVLGLAWLVALILLLARPAFGWWAALFCGVATLWYLPMGTAIGVLVIALLLTPPLRGLL
jgi:hypothetical protein